MQVHRLPAQENREEKEECEYAPVADEQPSARKGGIDCTKVKSEHPDAQRGSRAPYTLMDAARTVTLETGQEGAPADWIFVRFKDADEYNRITAPRAQLWTAPSEIRA